MKKVNVFEFEHQEINEKISLGLNIIGDFEKRKTKTINFHHAGIVELRKLSKYWVNNLKKISDGAFPETNHYTFK